MANTIKRHFALNSQIATVITLIICLITFNTEAFAKSKRHSSRNHQQAHLKKSHKNISKMHRKKKKKSHHAQINKNQKRIPASLGSQEEVNPKKTKYIPLPKKKISTRNLAGKSAKINKKSFISKNKAKSTNSKFSQNNRLPHKHPSNIHHRATQELISTRENEIENQNSDQNNIKKVDPRYYSITQNTEPAPETRKRKNSHQVTKLSEQEEALIDFDFESKSLLEQDEPPTH